MRIIETITQARDAMTVKRVFGDPFEKDGLTIIPVAWVAGAGGGGGDADNNGGGGFGVTAFPVGAYVLKDGDVKWVPSLNLNLVIVAGLFTLKTLAKVRAKKAR